jgi:hypothetical protein
MTEDGRLEVGEKAGRPKTGRLEVGEGLKTQAGADFIVHAPKKLEFPYDCLYSRKFGV